MFPGKQANDLKRVWIFTNDDDPFAGSKGEEGHCVQVAKDMADAGVDISLWHMNRTGCARFEAARFYARLLAVDLEDQDAIDTRMMGGGYEGFDAMMSNVRRKEHKKRRVGTGMLSFGDEMGQHMGVQYYRMLQIAKKPQHKWIFSGTNEALLIKTTLLDPNTGENVEKADVSTFVNAGSCKVRISKEEMNASILAGAAASKSLGKMIGGGSSSSNSSSSSSSSSSASLLAENEGAMQAFSGIQVLFFAPIALLPLDLNFEPPYFIFPDEATVQGSSRLFNALLQDLASKGLMAVTKFAKNERTSPRLAVMLPQMEELDEAGAQTRPPGFNLLALPFGPEIRCNPAPVPPNVVDMVNADMQGKAEALVAALSLEDSFSYQEIDSPAMQRFYSVLQAVALGQPHSDAADRLRPDDARLAAHKAEIAAFKVSAVLTDEALAAGQSKVSASTLVS